MRPSTMEGEVRGLEENEARRLGQLENGNGRPKKIEGQEALDIDALKVVLSKKR